MTTDPRVVLVGMSHGEVAARAALLELARPHGARLAYLQAGTPSVVGVLDDLADADGAGRPARIVLVGVKLGRLGPGASWLRRIVAHWWRERTGPRPTLDVATTLVADAAELRAVLDPAAGLTRAVSDGGAGLTSAAWEDVPQHRHQVLVCRGPRCAAQGAEAVAEALALELMSLGLGDDDVLVTHTGCQFPCNQAPVVTVQPDDVWYGGVDADVVRAIARQHLAAHTPVASHRLTRSIRNTQDPGRDH
ncbi:ferredoxin [Nocardioides sp. R-C-SC26]|uniref:(2Fe-2S) ferredoxin domain-containing protein n=1 Tax=Nocardioides sp. R-C-SC26 TaxID=2870414 RepID=UPI001E4D7998|nr:(2Fe-2S) ferredoxin domain-containing protein [Nocardioides sp. R-C-SC26]